MLLYLELTLQLTVQQADMITCQDINQEEQI